MQPLNIREIYKYSYGKVSMILSGKKARSTELKVK